VIRHFIAAAVAACTVGISIGCHHSPPATTVVPVPIGLDSAGVARWLGQQRAACRGRLITLLDQGAVRNFDSAATSTEFRYHSGLVGTQCQPYQVFDERLYGIGAAVRFARLVGWGNALGAARGVQYSGTEVAVSWAFALSARAGGYVGRGPDGRKLYLATVDIGFGL
jgi:hypothetical protein